jgi:very-short-patch-repair endonuclease
VQVTLRTRDRLDLLVDDWLVIELDGRGTHAQEDGFTRDRLRSARIIGTGRIVLQFAYATVLYDPEFLLATVREVMARHAPVSVRRA